MGPTIQTEVESDNGTVPKGRKLVCAVGSMLFTVPTDRHDVNYDPRVNRKGGKFRTEKEWD